MGKFVIKTTNTGVKFDLLATNGQVIATSQVYSSRPACLKGVKSVMTNAPWLKQKIKLLKAMKR